MPKLEEEGKMRANRFSLLLPVFLVSVLLALTAGCARTMPQEVTDVNRGLGQAKDACAGVYAADDLRTVQGDVDSMNQLADDGKLRKARKAAEPLLPRVGDLEAAAERARSEAKAEAEAAMAEANKAMAKAEDAEAPTLVASAFGEADAKRLEAERLFDDPCKYAEAAAAAKDAARLAANAAQAAVAERKRLDEEERRRAEEEARRKAEEEARRLAEERLKKYPPIYTVEKGDFLWRIAGMESIYGNSVYWPVVYDANGDLISDPDLIFPGQELSIPRDMSDEEMDEKLRMLWRKYSSGEDMEE
jgi:nucleoid-associated protein YgaU